MEERLVFEHNPTGLQVTTHRVLQRGRFLSDAPRDCEAAMFRKGWFGGYTVFIAAGYRARLIVFSRRRAGWSPQADRIVELAAAGLTGPDPVAVAVGLAKADAKVLTNDLASAFKKVEACWAQNDSKAAAATETEVSALKRL